MATSGTYIWNPDLAELVDEAMERARMDPAHITMRHILSARRSMRFMCADWATKDFHDFRVVETQFTVVQSQAVYVGGTDFDLTDNNLIDILDMSLRRNGVDTPIVFCPRKEYLDIPEKTTEGRTDRCFVDKTVDGLTLTFWPVPENSTDTVIFNGVRKFQDFDTAADTADIPYYMHDAFAYELAFRLCEKYSQPDLEQAMYVKAQNAFKTAQNAVRERGDVRIVPVSSRRRGRYR